MSASGKQLGLGAALLATLVAAYLSPESDANDGVVLSDRAARAATAKPGDAAPPPRAAASAARSPGSVVMDVLEIRSRDEPQANEGASLGVFVAQQWSPPIQERKLLQVPQQAASEVVPQAPPLPFRLLGRYEEEGSVVFFLQHNDRNLVVRLGDTIADHYRIESVQGNLLTLRYLPTNQTQTLDMGGAS